MRRTLLRIAQVVGLTSLCLLPAHAQPTDPLLAKAAEQTSLPLHRIGEPATHRDLKITLLSFGYAPKPMISDSIPPEDRRKDPGLVFHDAALHFVVRLKLENTSGGRYIPVDDLPRLVAEPRDVMRSAMDNWGNTITDVPWAADAPRRPESTLGWLSDPKAFTPGGPLTANGLLPPGSTCELEVELEPPFFIASSQYFLYFHPVLVSATPLNVEHVAFFIPASQVVMPKEGQFIINTPAFNDRYRQIINESSGNQHSNAASPKPAPEPAGTAK